MNTAEIYLFTKGLFLNFGNLDKENLPVPQQFDWTSGRKTPLERGR
ncbi:MAG: hypothetical protein ACI8RT_001425 [Candidatus Azotimanducaceae bacterium]|jgi:hypothetical protein|tara:strand:- start:403 stop:540 length:138 start_codon:yes stop_codon:yes gene_type:complete